MLWNSLPTATTGSFGHYDVNVRHYSIQTYLIQFSLGKRLHNLETLFNKIKFPPSFHASNFKRSRKGVFMYFYRSRNGVFGRLGLTRDDIIQWHHTINVRPSHVSCATKWWKKMITMLNFVLFFVSCLLKIRETRTLKQCSLWLCIVNLCRLLPDWETWLHNDKKRC